MCFGHFDCETSAECVGWSMDDKPARGKLRRAKNGKKIGDLWHDESQVSGQSELTEHDFRIGFVFQMVTWPIELIKRTGTFCCFLHSLVFSLPSDNKTNQRTEWLRFEESPESSFSLAITNLLKQALLHYYLRRTVQKVCSDREWGGSDRGGSSLRKSMRMEGMRSRGKGCQRASCSEQKTAAKKWGGWRRKERREETRFTSYNRLKYPMHSELMATVWTRTDESNESAIGNNHTTHRKVSWSPDDRHSGQCRECRMEGELVWRSGAW